MSTGHSLLAPSAAARWIACPGSVALSQGHDFGGNEYTAEGTAAHWLAEQALRSGKPCEHWLGETHTVLSDDGLERWDIPIDAEMCSYVQVYVDYVFRRHQEMPGALLIEHRADLSNVLGIADQGGTADAVLADTLITGTLEVIDLKYGRGKAVEAEGNEQLMLYALGCLDHFGDAEFEQVVLTICQPRLDSMPQVTMTPAELRAFGEKAKSAAITAVEVLDQPQHIERALNPGDKQCQWCPAKATCPALAQHVLDTVFPEREEPLPDPATAAPVLPSGNVDVLGRRRRLVPLIEDWCKAIRAEVQARTERGEMPGWVLERGRAGARVWSDEEAAEQMLKKSFRLKNDKMYNLKLISPTQAEKVLSPARYERVSQYVTRADGKAVAVPESEADPAKIVPPANMFDEPSIEDLI